MAPITPGLRVMVKVNKARSINAAQQEFFISGGCKILNVSARRSVDLCYGELERRPSKIRHAAALYTRSAHAPVKCSSK